MSVPRKASEAIAQQIEEVEAETTGRMMADIALIASLLADTIEREIEREGPWVPIGDPLFNEDGTPWSSSDGVRGPGVHDG